ncbi:MAG: VWA domain-containing protein [Spirochaetaceae bacterium]|jgi:Ca-activated chloride channel family protein|nr:VWA domain-containing protein [Spirochaetaceae bacterium]
MNVGFSRPILVLAAIAVPLAVLIVRRFFIDVFAVNLPLGVPGGALFKPPFSRASLQKAALAMELAGIAALLFAASGPRLVSRQIVYLDRGADVLFILDCSPSMAALDMAGKSRFDAARSLILNFITERPADAAGLIAVGNDAVLLIPPTTDRTALQKRLESLQIGEFGDGTALGMGIAAAALHLSRSTAAGKAVALITDGENNAGAIHPETAAAVLRETVDRLSFFVIAAGSFGEVPVDYVDPKTGARRSGVFQSRYDEHSLIRIAESGGGVFLSASTADALKEAFSTINNNQIYVSRSAMTERSRTVHHPFIAAGLLLVCIPFIWRRLLLGAFL